MRVCELCDAALRAAGSSTSTVAVMHAAQATLDWGVSLGERNEVALQPEPLLPASSQGVAARADSLARGAAFRGGRRAGAGWLVDGPQRAPGAPLPPPPHVSSNASCYIDQERLFDPQLPCKSPAMRTTWPSAGSVCPAGAQAGMGRAAREPVPPRRAPDQRVCHLRGPAVDRAGRAAARRRGRRAAQHGGRVARRRRATALGAARHRAGGAHCVLW